MQKMFFIIVAAVIALFGVLGPVGSPRNAVIAGAGQGGLVSWWSAEGNANDVIDGNLGTLINGATFGPGKVGQAFSFDGIDDRVEVQSSSNLDITGPITITAWFRLIEADYSSPIAAKWGDSMWGTAGYGLFVQGGYVEIDLSSDGFQHYEILTPYPFPLNEWHHLAGVYDGSVEKLYVDGVLVAEQTIGSINIHQTPAPFTMGSYSYPDFTHFSGPLKGAIDEVRIYNTALSPAEIQDIFTSGGGGGPANQSPVANAGTDQTVHVGDSVTLDGTGSNDPDGNTPLSFAWSITSQPAGSTAVLSDPTASMPSFTPDKVGDYTIQLVVTDTLGASSSDTVVISTTNSAPVADAGPDQLIVAIGTTVQLNGGTSYDTDGDSITYSWSLIQKPQSSNATLSNSAIPNPTFVADVHGDYVASLVVTDEHGAASNPDTVTVSFMNVKPVANAGQNQAVAVGQTVFLSGSGSSDANGDTLTYSWSMTSRPASSLAELANTTGMDTSFIADMPGIYVVSLVVNDGFVDSDPASVTITATITKNQVIDEVETIIDVINGLNLNVLKNPNMGNALTNKLNAVLADIDQGLYQDALDKLQNDILAKTDGCALGGAPDKNDWIKDCASQSQVYPLIMEAVILLQSLI